jgi:hypothetical protein
MEKPLTFINPQGLNRWGSKAERGFRLLTLY